MKHIENTEQPLQEFSQMSLPNSISPKIVADLLTLLLEKVDDAIPDESQSGTDPAIIQANNIEALPKRLESGMYRVLIAGNTPYLLKVKKTSSTNYEQYLFDFDERKISILNRQIWSNGYTTWGVAVDFRSQAFPYECKVEFDASGNLTSFVSDEPMRAGDGMFAIRAYHDDGNDSTAFFGFYTRFYDENADGFLHQIISPKGIYFAQTGYNEPPANFAFKPFAFQADIESVVGYAFSE